MADPYARRRLVLVAALAATTVGLVALLAGADSDGSAALTTTTTTTIRRTTPSTLDVAAIASSDRFAVAPGTGAAVGQGERWTYTVEVEVGIPIDPAGLAAVVDTVLADPRGWTAGGDVQLQRGGARHRALLPHPLGHAGHHRRSLRPARHPR